jgi:hypothetical protein
VSKTPTSLSFQPAPRPQTRLTAADAARLAEANADLGFARPVSSPETAALEARPVESAPAAPAARRSKTAPAPPAARAMAALKVEVPDQVWAALKIEAIRRRVTVKFLVLEALARQGYEIDLANVPQDGRRLR